MSFELTCREFVEFLGEYLEQRLPEETRAAFACDDEGLPADVPADLVAAVLASRRVAR